MKITCTKLERDDLIVAMANSQFCFVPMDCELDEDGCQDCTECLKKNIDWEVTDG